MILRRQIIRPRHRPVLGPLPAPDVPVDRSYEPASELPRLVGERAANRPVTGPGQPPLASFLDRRFSASCSDESEQLTRRQNSAARGRWRPSSGWPRTGRSPPSASRSKSSPAVTCRGCADRPRGGRRYARVPGRAGNRWATMSRHGSSIVSWTRRRRLSTRTIWSLPLTRRFQTPTSTGRSSQRSSPGTERRPA
jgi:hypothetical protein